LGNVLRREYDAVDDSTIARIVEQEIDVALAKSLLQRLPVSDPDILDTRCVTGPHAPYYR
jgi:hypothetical protein